MCRLLMKDMHNAFGNLTLSIAENIQQLIEVSRANSPEWNMQGEPQHSPTDHERGPQSLPESTLGPFAADKSSDPANQEHNTDSQPEQCVSPNAIGSRGNLKNGRHLIGLARANVILGNGVVSCHLSFGELLLNFG